MVIKKKSKKKLNNDYIEIEFLKNVPPCGIVAMWITNI
jgi:hypothetical protein